MTKACLPNVAPNGPEIRLEISANEGSRWFGNRAQLEAEGLLPESQTWSKGRDHEQCQVGSLIYRLTRAKPPGCNSRRRADWADADYWCLDIRRAGESLLDQRIRAAEQELARLKWLASPAGARMANGLWAAMNDSAFQRFKSGLAG